MAYCPLLKEDCNVNCAWLVHSEGTEEAFGTECGIKILAEAHDAMAGMVNDLIETLSKLESLGNLLSASKQQ